MRAILQFKNKEDKVIRFINSDKLVDILCDTKVGVLFSYVLIHCFDMQSVTFKK